MNQIAETDRHFAPIRIGRDPSPDGGHYKELQPFVDSGNTGQNYEILKNFQAPEELTALAGAAGGTRSEVFVLQY